MLVSVRAHADISYEIPEDLYPPETYQDIVTVVENEIPAAIEKGAQCGGWDLSEEQRVGEELGEPWRISKVTGLPGREGEPMGNSGSGLAKRIEQGGVLDDGYLFPETALGLTTDCAFNRGGDDTIFVWEDGPDGQPGSYVPKDFTMPYFENPPCRWAGEPATNRDSEEDGPQTPEQCVLFCEWLNTFTYEDCAAFNDVYADEEGNIVGELPSDRQPTPDDGVPGGGFARTRAARSVSSAPTVAQRTLLTASLLAQTLGPSPGSQDEPVFSTIIQNPQPAPTFTTVNSKPEPVPTFTTVNSNPEPTPTFPTAITSTSEPGSAFPTAITSTSEPGSAFPTVITTGSDPTPSSFPTFITTSGKTSSFGSDETSSFGSNETSSFGSPSSSFSTFSFPATSSQASKEGGSSSVPGNPPPEGAVIIGQRCAQWVEKFLCSRQTLDEGFPNCVMPCRGEECRCPGPGCEQDPRGQNYQSFFRFYSAETERAGLTQVPLDQLKRVSAEVACYGLYDERDAKDEILTLQCVIRFPYSKKDGNPFADSALGLKTSQAGVGQYMPTVPDKPFRQRNPGYAKEDDLWYPNLGDGISFLSEPVFTEDYDRVMHHTFFDLDFARVTAYTQNTDERTMAPTYLQRAIDDTIRSDTGAARIFINWIQKFTTDMAKLISPPVVRLRLPAAWAPGLEGLPLASPPVVTDGGEAGRWRTIEVQLQARDDLLGIVSGLLERFLLLKPVPVPVVIPLGSPLTYRALAQRWEDYRNQREALELDVPDEVDDVIAKLLEYADEIDDYRALRGELPGYIGVLLQRQRELLLGINEWAQKNLERYIAWLETRDQRLLLQDKVRQVQQALSDIHDGTDAVPWCRSDYFTTSIYSLLDYEGWYPGRPSLQGGVPSCEGGEDSFPIICENTRDEDINFDLDLMKFFFPGGSAVIVPVPDPVQIELTLPTPPPADEEVTDLDALTSLPDLPPVPTFDAVNIVAPRLAEAIKQGEEPVSLPEPPPLDTTQQERAMDRAIEILTKMREAYKRFWKDMEPSEETRGYECPKIGKSPCSYAEPELIQIFTRLTARPQIILLEDAFGPVGIRTETCNPADETCRRMRAERRNAGDGWQIIGPSDAEAQQSALIDDLRTMTRELTITPEGKTATDPATGVQYPYPGRTEDLYPIFGLPRDTPLIPQNP